MQIYSVGGSVRDKLLGLIPKDSDYLVIGTTLDEMLEKGYIQVGEAFPVLLHPETQDEYTLASNLLDDLKRRDLTINAMAMDVEGKLFDLFGGEKDLKDQILRHVSSDNFYTDPLRVLRVARFQTQFSQFIIAPETKKLMTEVGHSPSFREISPDRIIQELKKCFELKNPSLFFRTLKSVDCLSVHFSELSGLTDEKLETSLDLFDKMSNAKLGEVVLFTALVREFTFEELSSLSHRLSIPNSWLEASRATILYQQARTRLSPESLIDFFYKIDAFRKPNLVKILCALDLQAGINLQSSFDKVREVSASQIDSSISGKALGEAIRFERLKLLRNEKM